MRFPAECVTAEDRAEFCEQLKRELIADHNATKDRATKEAILGKLKIVGYWGAVARDECGAAQRGGEENLAAIKEAAKAKRFKITAEHKDIDYYRDRAATVTAVLPTELLRD